MGELTRAGAVVWAISADDPANVRSFRDQQGRGITFLVDADGATFSAYGIRNERSEGTIPHPTVVVVDTAGVARYVVTEADYKVRPPASDVVAVVEGLAAP